MPKSFIPYGPDPGTVARRSATLKGASETRDGETDTFHHDVVVTRDDRNDTGIYLVQTGAHVVQAAAHAATAGFWFLINPVGATTLLALRRVEFMSQLGSALLTPTSPRIQLERFTFTGTATGAVVAPASANSAFPAATGSLRTANTGLTITSGAAVFAFLPIASATAAGYVPATAADYLPEGNAQPVLAAGQGLILRQPDPGTTADTRRFLTNIAFEEYTEIG